MPNAYDQDKVRAALQKGSRLAQKEANPQWQAYCARILAANGLTPEPGKSAAQTVVEHVLTLSPGTMNGERRRLDETKWSEDSIADSVSEKIKGIGSKKDVAEFISQVRHDYEHDTLLARTLKRDYDTSRALPETIGTDRSRDEQSRRATVEREINKREAPLRGAEAKRLGLDDQNMKTWNGEHRTVHSKMQLDVERAAAKVTGTAPTLRLEGSAREPVQTPAAEPARVRSTYTSMRETAQRLEEDNS